MLGFAIVAVAIVLVGCAVIRRDDFSLPEHVTAGAVAGLAIWLAIHWLLAITHTLTKLTVAATAIVFVAAATAFVWRHRSRVQNLHVGNETAAALALLIPLFLWTIFILWRGTLIPPLSHDALAYHLPKALLMARAHGFEPFVAPDPRIGAYPFNYELLLADVLLLTGSDALTEWIGTATFFLFLIATAAVAQRWFGSAIGTLGAVLATASAPVLLLHSGADKNDLLTGFFSIAALLFGARWCVHGGRTAMALLILALVCGVGTKPNLAAIAVGLAPFLLLRLWRKRPDAKSIALTAAFSVAVFVLCGGWSYLANWMASGAPVGVRAGDVEIGSQAAPIPYGDWFNVWQFPYLLATIPFAPSQHGVWVPWAGEYWFWAHYELYWSHYGFVFSAAIVFLPFAIFRYRREGERGERRIAGIATLVAVLLMLPVVSRPIGFFGTYTRYFLFILPIVYGWTAAPLVAELATRWRRTLLAALAVAVSFYAVMSLINDRFAPLEFVVWARNNPGTRMVWFMPSRAASVADRRAAPDETIAVDGAFDTWVWPAYGRNLSRPVIFLPQGTDPDAIPPQVNWVVVDRSWNALWSNPEITTMGKMWGKVGTGTMPPSDVELFEKLRRDPRWNLVFRNESANQAVFRRKR
ncbi:MAG TPA: hypothetical protein VF111_04360 [Thermoanaerobaculia bacterium]